MNNHVQYKKFEIAIRANLDGSPMRFDVVWQIRGSEAKTNLVHSRFTSKEFASEKAGYDFGLQAARTWIDEHPSLIAEGIEQDMPSGPAVLQCGNVQRPVVI